VDCTYASGCSSVSWCRDPKRLEPQTTLRSSIRDAQLCTSGDEAEDSWAFDHIVLDAIAFISYPWISAHRPPCILQKHRRHDCYTRDAHHKVRYTIHYGSFVCFSVCLSVCLSHSWLDSCLVAASGTQATDHSSLSSSVLCYRLHFEARCPHFFFFQLAPPSVPLWPGRTYCNTCFAMLSSLLLRVCSSQFQFLLVRWDNTAWLLISYPR